MSAPTTAALRQATTTLAEHAAAVRALAWLAETHPDLPTGMVDLSVYRREGEAVGDARRQLSVQVRSIDDVAAWALALDPGDLRPVQLDDAQHTPGRLRAFVSGEVFDVPVHVYALLRVEVLDIDDDALAPVAPAPGAAGSERHLRVATPGGAR